MNPIIIALVAFLVVSGAFGFIWLFMLPFLVPMVIEADPTRKAAMLLSGAQLLGGSLGPLIASLVVSDADSRGAVAFGAAALVLAVAIGSCAHEDGGEDQRSSHADHAHYVGEHSVVIPLVERFFARFGEAVIDGASPILIDAVIAAGREKLLGANQAESVVHIR